MKVERILIIFQLVFTGSCSFSRFLTIIKYLEYEIRNCSLLFSSNCYCSALSYFLRHRKLRLIFTSKLLKLQRLYTLN
jgi:hypothetical protein